MVDEVNPNVLWSRIFTDELIRSGLDTVIIAPGSHSTPLVLAFEKSKIEMYSIVDERSAGFFALGVAKATQKPVAVVCTSGTAVANLFPAILEAVESHSPLILLTADRPHELRKSGANQTMDQIKLFNDKVKWFIDVKEPSSSFEERTVRYLRTTACRVYDLACSNPKGVIHANFPFTKPLEPATRDELSKIKSMSMSESWFAKKDPEPYTRFYTGKLRLSKCEIDSLCNLLSSKRKGIIIAGQMDGNNERIRELMHELSRILRFPIFADPFSQLRFSIEGAERVIGGYESFFQSQVIRDRVKPEIIIQFGKSPTSKYLLLFLEEKRACERILISSSGRWEDEAHGLSKVVTADYEILLKSLIETLKILRKSGSENSLLASIQNIEKEYWNYLKLYFQRYSKEVDIMLYLSLFSCLPDNSLIFGSNSLPVRHVDQFGKPINKNFTIFGNRGVSGIDGNISTFAGIMKNSKQANILLIGDIAFLHDINSLLTLVKYNLNLKIILFNNSGGGIFTRLPIRTFNPEFKEYFLTPQQSDFSATQAMFGISYICIEKIRELKAILLKELSVFRPAIIEVQTNAERDNLCRLEFLSSMKSELEKSLQKDLT